MVTLYSLLLKGLLNCNNCPLSSRPVPGAGFPLSPLVLVGEAPGEYEIKLGLPFVGRAGKLLNSLLDSVGILRQHIYITNVVKCRPPNNRTPRSFEIEACSKWLLRELELISPKVVVTLGSTAFEFFGGKGRISKARGVPFVYNNILIIPTFHPSYLLRNPKFAKVVEEDLRLARGRVYGTGGSSS